MIYMMEMKISLGLHIMQVKDYHLLQIQTALTSLLSLFCHQANSVAMIRHSMDVVVKAAVSILNPGQIPIIACDQPLYALAKQIQ